MSRLFCLFVLIALTATLTFLPVEALATGFKGITKNVGQNISTVPKLIAYTAYIIGTAFAVRSLFSLRGFIDNPDDNPVSKFIGLAATAALLISLPFVLDVVIKTMSGSDRVEGDVYSSAGSFEDGGK